jgi:hypothetical protein
VRWRAQRRSQAVAAVLPGRQEQSDEPDLDWQLNMLTALGQLPWGSARACSSTAHSTISR